MSGAYTAQSFKGIPVAIEKHSDGAVTLCKEIVDQIKADAQMPRWLKDIL